MSFTRYTRTKKSNQLLDNFRNMFYDHMIPNYLIDCLFLSGFQYCMI